MASTSFKITPSSVVIPVSVFNVQTRKPIVIQMEVDTGAFTTVLPQKYAAPLGVDLKDGTGVNVGGLSGYSDDRAYLHEGIQMQIGSLKPISANIVFDKNVPVPLMGRIKSLSYYGVSFTATQVTFTELAPQAIKLIQKVRIYNKYELPSIKTSSI